MPELEIKARERSLEREQEAWRTEKATIEREVQRLKAESDTIFPKVKAARTQLEGMKRAVESLQVAQTNYRQENSKLEQELRLKQDTLNRFATKITDMVTKIEELKANADTEVEAYKAQKVVEANEALADLDAKVENRRKQLTDIGASVAEHLVSVVEAASAAKQATTDLTAIREQIAEETIQLGADTSLLRSTKQRLQAEASGLQAQNNELTEVNIKLDQRNKQFVAYEQRAWKLLVAKDDELQGREMAIRGKESLTPSIKSFLPPISE